MNNPQTLADLCKRDDTIRFKLFANRAIVQQDARISVEVNALIGTSQVDQTELLRRIRTALNAFIKTDWGFSAIKRMGEAVGFERVSLQAAARVPSSEVFNLEERARQASTEGLALKEPIVNYSLPADKVSAIVRELQQQLVGNINEQIGMFDHATGRNWRLGNLAFGVWDPSNSDNRSAKGAYRSSDSSIGDLMFDLGESGMTGAEKIALVADVELRSTVD